MRQRLFTIGCGYPDANDVERLQDDPIIRLLAGLRPDDNYIRSDEATKAQSKVKEEGKYSFIDKVKVRLVDSEYWAEGVNFGNRFLHIPVNYVRDYERLLMGGVWAQIDVRFEYDEENKGKNPFWIDKLSPIQIAAFDLDEYRRLRREFTADEWVDLLIRSMGYEPSGMERRLKLLFLLRLIPLTEQNYNVVELGPRGTGKSYAVQELSPYGALLTGPTTVANMFGHMTGKHKGMVAIWDVVAFDEVADLQKMPKEVITTLKTYCESGTFQRGKEADRDETRELASFKPDAAFSVCDTEESKTLLFFLEVDLGTETLASPKRGLTDIRQKILNYGACFDTQVYKQYEKLWSCRLNGFRLLFLTDTLPRMSALCSLVREMPPSDFIWITEKDRMFAEGISAQIWARGGRSDASPQSILGKLCCLAPLA